MAKEFNFSAVFVSPTRHSITNVSFITILKPERYNLFSQMKQLTLSDEDEVAIYCEGGQNTHVPLCVWLQGSFDGVSWFSIILLFLLPNLILISNQSRIKSLCGKVELLFLSSVAVLLRQGISTYKKHLLSAIVLATAFMVPTLYETYFTCESIAPPERKTFDNFTELLDNGYKYLIQMDRDYMTRHSVFAKSSSDFYRFGYQYHWGIEKSARAFRMQGITYHRAQFILVANLTLKLIILVPKEFAALHLQEIHQENPNVKCSAAKQVAETVVDTWEFHNGLRDEFQAFCYRLTQEGFPSTWKSLDPELLKNRRARARALYEESAAESISLGMKIHTIFIFLGYFNFGSFLIFLLEVLVGRFSKLLAMYRFWIY